MLLAARNLVVRLLHWASSGFAFCAAAFEMFDAFFSELAEEADAVTFRMNMPRSLANMQRQLLEFHRKFDAVVNNGPTVPDDDTLKLRRELILEESQEFFDASHNKDLVEMADALGDILYVTIGAAVSLGIDIEEVFNEIHRSNMTKVWPDGTVHYNESKKVLKPPTYSPADIRGVLHRQFLRSLGQ